MFAAARAPIIALTMALAGCADDVELPPALADSKYITYHTDVDASVICMDDHLAREDVFIERTSAALGVDVPSGTIDFVWDPEQDGSEPWVCSSSSADACYVRRQPSGADHIASRAMTQRHELVHWISIPSLGRGHRILEEGLAEYLGTLNQTPPSDDFPAEFKELLLTDPRTVADYRLAMRFVGWVFLHHGVANYRALRAKIPRDASPEQFADVFAAQLGQPLDDALAEMRGEHIYGVDTIAGCEEDDTPELIWSGESLEATVESTCGDPFFFGAGFLDGRAGFYGRYRVEVPTAGYYALTADGVAGGPAPTHANLLGCTRDLFGMGLLSRDPEPRLLAPGTYLMAIGFPEAAEARGAATVRLAYVGPPD